MAAFLIDTHTFLWLSSGSPELSKKVKDLLLDIDNDVFISIASIWEMSIKNSLDKLEIKGGLRV